MLKLTHCLSIRNFVFFTKQKGLIAKIWLPKLVNEPNVNIWKRRLLTLANFGNGYWKLYSSDASNSYIASSPLGEVNIPEITFHELIVKNWSLWEKKIATICGTTGRKYTFKRIRNASEALAASLQNKLKLNKGDFLALILLNCPEYPIAVLACSMAGIIPTTVNPTYTPDEMKTQLLECNIKAVITDNFHAEKCLQVIKLIEIQVPVIVIDNIKNGDFPQGCIDFFEFCDSSKSGNLNPVKIDFDDTLILPYSSGTTGVPKGVILTHRNVVSNLTQISHPEALILSPTTRFHQDTILGVLPMFHIYGLIIVTFQSLKEGCRLIILPRFDPRVYLTNVVKKRANILYVVPPIKKFLGHEKIPGKYLKNVDYIINAASPMNVSSAYTLLEKAPHLKIAQGYGMTESSPALSHTSSTRMQKLKSIGIPAASTKFKICSLETGEILPKGKTGELLAWGPQVMKGYLNRPEETKNAFDDQGWLKTGDVGYYDDDGDFFIVDRTKSLIKVKGFQVAPAELEELLLTNPKIKDVAIVGVKDEQFGELPRAYVVVHEGVEMTEEEVKEIIAAKMSSYKHLKGGVRFINTIPRNTLGKILRKELEKTD